MLRNFLAATELVTQSKDSLPIPRPVHETRHASHQSVYTSCVSSVSFWQLAKGRWSSRGTHSRPLQRGRRISQTVHPQDRCAGTWQPTLKAQREEWAILDPLHMLLHMESLQPRLWNICWPWVQHPPPFKSLPNSIFIVTPVWSPITNGGRTQSISKVKGPSKTLALALISSLSALDPTVCAFYWRRLSRGPLTTD